MSDTRELIIENKRGKHAMLYDAEDEELVQAYNWHFDGNGYVRTNISHPEGGWTSPPNGRRQRRTTTLYFHRLVMNPPKGKYIDHVNHNILDNRKENLHIATPGENSQNRGKQKNNKSGFKGVYYMKKPKDMINERKKPHVAQIYHNGKRIHIGLYSTEEEAAEAYDRKACELWDIVNPERQLNFPERYEEYMSDLTLIK
jgi:hypothetical protein